MRLTLKYEGKTHTLRLEEPDSPRALVVDAVCPMCGAVEWYVQGRGKRPGLDDRSYDADAVSVCCGARAGTIRAGVDTIFGVTEDRNVLEMGRARVY